jgi:hypothetical protein
MRKLDGVLVRLDHAQSVALAAELIADCLRVNEYMVSREMQATDPETENALRLVYKYLTGKNYVHLSANDEHEPLEEG